MKHLVIVQNKPTQFDVPLYNKIARNGPFRLTVIYSQFSDDQGSFDPEIGRSPAWDHIKEERYKRIDLSQKQSAKVSLVVSIIANLEPDLIVISGYYPPLHRKLVKPLRKMAFKVGLRSDNTLRHSNFSGIKGLIKHIVLPFWLRRYSSWHPVGSMATTYLEKVTRVKRPIYLFPYNVDNDWFFDLSKKYQEEKGRLLDEMGFSNRNFIVLGIMKWHIREDPLTLIDAFKQLVIHNADARLILVGDGPLRDEVSRRLDDKDILGKVITPGYVTYLELPKYYAMADVFVHPAPDEPWGVSVNEAMSCGVPVIAAEGVGSGRDLIIENQTGYVFNNGNSNELAKLLELVSSRDDREKMSMSCISMMAEWSYVQSISEFQKAMSEL